MRALTEALARHTEAAPEIVVVHGVAGLVHDFYTGIEKALRTVGQGLEGSLPTGDAWHRDLLRSATLTLPGVRPPVLGVETAERLTDFLAFRHLYRNLYAFNLRWPRVRALALEVADVWPAPRADLAAFATFLDELAAGV